VAANLNSEKIALENQLASANAELKAGHEATRNLENQVYELKAAVQVVGQQKDADILVLKAELQAAKRQTEEAEADLGTTRGGLEKARKECDRLAGETETLSADLSKKNERLATLRTRVKALSAETQEQKNKLEVAQQELARVGDVSSRFNALVSEAEDLRNENQAARGKIDSLKARLNQAKSAEQESAQRADSLQHELRQVKTDLDQVSHTNSELKAENTAVQGALSEAQKSLEKAANLNNKLQHTNDENQATLVAARSSLAEAKTQVEDLKDSIDELTRRKNQAEEASKDSEIRLLKLSTERKETVAALQAEIDGLKTGREELEKELYQRRAEASEQERKLFIEEESRRKAETESKQLTKQVSQLTVKVAELEQGRAKASASNQPTRQLTEALAESRRNNDFLVAQLHKHESRESYSGGGGDSFFEDDLRRSRGSTDAPGHESGEFRGKSARRGHHSADSGFVSGDDEPETGAKYQKLQKQMKKMLVANSALDTIAKSAQDRNRHLEAELVSLRDENRALVGQGDGRPKGPSPARERRGK
jgi:chromosome segregation ATPase